MKICFRVDASINIGSGHVMRCLTLAEEFIKNGHSVFFITRLHDGHLCDLITKKGFEVLTLEKTNMYNKGNLKHSSWLGVTQDEDIIETRKLIIENNHTFDWIIIDHYAIDKTWESEVRNYIPNVMVIDDIADREHNCDILLDQNYYKNADIRYNQLVPGHCNLLLGPKYALLRDEFIDLHKLYKQQKKLKAILVFYGGSDPTNETLKAMNAIKKMQTTNLTTHVVVGLSNPNANMIKKQCDEINFIFHYNIDYMGKLMYEVDFAICAGGSTTWERYCVGLPAILTAVAYNQVELCENIQYLGIDKYVGPLEMVTEQTIENEITSFLNNASNYRRNERAKKIVDGKGKIRMLEMIENISSSNK